MKEKQMKVSTHSNDELSENKYYFRTLILNRSSITFSQLEGFKRRYPKAWLNRESYSFYNHSSIQDISLKGEYRFNLCYCFVEYARENEALAKELKPFFLNFEKPLTQTLMKYSHDRQFLEAAIQKYMEDLVHHKYFGWKVCLMVSFLDYLMETLSIPYPPSIKKEIVALFNEGSTKYLQTYGNKSILKMRYFSDAIHQKKGLVYQFLQDYYKKYSAFVGQPLSNFIKEKIQCSSADETTPATESTRILFSAKNLFGLDYYSTDSPFQLSTTEILEILAAMAYYCDLTPEVWKRQTKETLTTLLTDEKWEELLTFCQKYLLIYVAEYLLAKEHRANRNLFFKLTDTADLISLKHLENENTQQRQLLKEDKKKIKALEKEVSLLKTTQTQKIKEALSQKETKLVEANRKLAKQTTEMEQLNVELMKYKETVEILQQQLSEQLEKSLQATPSLSAEAKETLNKPSILFVGGHPNTINKLKTILPACKFFEVDKTYDVHFSKTIEQVFIFADYVNHGMVYHLNRFLSAPKRVLTGNNVEFLLKQCLELVGNH